MSLGKSTRRNFTDAARAAALEARQRKKGTAPPCGTPEVFAVRLPDACLLFGWEIRRFGAVVLDKSEVGYASPAAARSAGLEALPGQGVRA